MRRVCAWCKREYGASPNELDRDLVTHGICEECKTFFETNQPGSLRQFLNGFDSPILCVDSNLRVTTANDAACRLLGKEREDLGDLMCGDVVECRWARLPGGCGETDHCLGCTIRLLVTATTASGQGQPRRPAYVDRELADGTQQRIHLVLSSERQNELVLLRIDEMEPEVLPPSTA